MRMFRLSIHAGITLFCIAFIFNSSAVAQSEAQTSDSATVSEMKQLQRELLDQMQELRGRLEALLGTEDLTEHESRIETLERRLNRLEARIDSLDSEIERTTGGPDNWDDWSDSWWDSSWEDEPAEGKSGWDWWLNDEEEENQFGLSENFFKKFPGNFPWMFPLTSRLHETFFRYNRVEGVYIGLAQIKRLYWHSKPSLVSTASLGYGFANHTWRYSLGLYFPFYFENQIIELGGEGHSFTDSKDQWNFDRDENTWTSILAREDFLDYFERRGFSVSSSWYHRGEDGLNLRISLGYVHDTYQQMNTATQWSVFGGDKRFRPNPLANNGNLNSIVLSGGVHTLPSLSDRSHGWDAQFLFEKAGGITKGDFEFTQVTLDVRRYQPTSKHIRLNARLRAGLSSGVVPVQRQFEAGGPGTLPGYRFKEFSGSHILLFNGEIIIRSTIAGESKGWAGNVLRNTNLILFYDAGTVNQSQQLIMPGIQSGAYQASFKDGVDFEPWKSDVGVAVGSQDGDLRIGAAWRLDKNEAPNFIFRLSRPF